MNAEANPSELPAMILSKEETLILWQLMNIQGAAVPLKFAQSGADLFKTVRDYAKAHGIPVE